jgi:hypothetical protein
MSTIIIISTFLVKQHALIDAFAGFLLVELVYLLIARLEFELKPSLNKQEMGKVYRG